LTLPPPAQQLGPHMSQVKQAFSRAVAEVLSVEALKVSVPTLAQVWALPNPGPDLGVIPPGSSAACFVMDVQIVGDVEIEKRVRGLTVEALHDPVTKELALAYRDQDPPVVGVSRLVRGVSAAGAVRVLVLASTILPNSQIPWEPPGEALTAMSPSLLDTLLTGSLKLQVGQIMVKGVDQLWLLPVESARGSRVGLPALAELLSTKSAALQSNSLTCLRAEFEIKCSGLREAGKVQEKLQALDPARVSAQLRRLRETSSWEFPPGLPVTVGGVSRTVAQPCPLGSGRPQPAPRPYKLGAVVDTRTTSGPTRAHYELRSFIDEISAEVISRARHYNQLELQLKARAEARSTSPAGG